MWIGKKGRRAEDGRVAAERRNLRKTRWEAEKARERRPARGQGRALARTHLGKAAPPRPHSLTATHVKVLLR